MRTLMLELRDRMTFIPTLAIEISGKDGYLAQRAGYQSPCILFGRLDGGKFFYDPYDWADRTWKTAHTWIVEHFDELVDGAVIDVEFILGETTTCKRSEGDGGIHG